MVITPSIMRCTENLKQKLLSNGFCQPWLLGFARVSTLPMSRIVMTNDKVVLYVDPCMILWLMLFYVLAVDLIILNNLIILNIKRRNNIKYLKQRMFICFTLGLGACQHQDMVD